MSTLLFTQLRTIQTRLQHLNTAVYSPVEQQELHALLSATLKALDKLQQNGVALSQQFQLMQNLNLLEQQVVSLAPGTNQALSLCQTLHRFLQTAIQTTLSDEANAGRAGGA